MKQSELPPAWTELLERVRNRQSSPILMPAALHALVDLAEAGRVKEGRVSWAEFKPAFEKVMTPINPKKCKQAWRPFYHMSGKIGLWSLALRGAPADFTQLRKGKPSSAASLESCADEAIVAELLRATLESESGRKLLRSSL